MAAVALPTVVIPVYNAVEDLARCLESVRDTLPPGARALVIDDASPDPAVADLLAEWARRHPAATRWRFLRNPVNLGFVGTANRGLSEAGCDAVLLNSDTRVTPGWLQGLGRCLASDSAIATATPWTNNGEIASLPRFCVNNPVPPDPAGVAAAIAEAIEAIGGVEYPELPTAVGFCMAVSRRAIERVGLFDEATFGRGYGEENDFSMRARAAGLRNVLCDDVYVAHAGNRSFGPEGLKPGEDSMRRLLSRHPDYLRQVEAFIAADPLAARRQALVDAIRRRGVSLG